MTTGEKIAALRKEKGITQEQMAEMLNVSRQQRLRRTLGGIAPGPILRMLQLPFSCSVPVTPGETFVTHGHGGHGRQPDALHPEKTEK